MRQARGLTQDQAAKVSWGEHATGAPWQMRESGRVRIGLNGLRRMAKGLGYEVIIELREVGLWNKPPPRPVKVKRPMGRPRATSDDPEVETKRAVNRKYYEIMRNDPERWAARKAWVRKKRRAAREARREAK